MQVLVPEGEDALPEHVMSHRFWKELRERFKGKENNVIEVNMDYKNLKCLNGELIKIGKI